MKRRTFLELAALGMASNLAPGSFAEALSPSENAGEERSPEWTPIDTYGSGHFGRWERDQHGLPSYRYTCNQLTDPRAVQPVDQTWRSPIDHMHQVGNDRLVAVVSNFGHVQVRQDEGSPKFLNDYHPEKDCYGGGIGFLADEGLVLSTRYSGATEKFDRIFGMGYLRKRVAARSYSVDQVIFAPFGDDPVLVSQVTIANSSERTVRPRWVEYWGCNNYQFSYRALMESGVLVGTPNAVERRRGLSDRFSHRFQKLDHERGLLGIQTFLGRVAQEEQAWQQAQASLKDKPTGFFGGPTPPLPQGTSMEDLSPPATFLVSLDAPVDACATHGPRFFRGSAEHPQGISAPLDNDLGAQGPESAFLLERQIVLQPGESRTLYFLYGYLPDGFSVDSLVAKYAAAPSTLWSRSSAQWKASAAPIFRAEAHPWIERELQWSSYYLRSGFTYDSFFREHILSQGAGYQYLAGLQCAARDPLQHVLPLIFTDPHLVRSVLRYTFKEMQTDGALPYGIVGAGVPAPCVYKPSDLHLWLLWVVSEYVLATRDRDFLQERIPPYPRQNSQPDDPTVLDLLERSFVHLTSTIGVGKHGLQRLLNGDWNDSIVYTHLTPEQQQKVLIEGESVLNAAMAAYVFDYFATMLDGSERAELASQVRAMAAAQRHAVQKQWHGQWYRRAWLSEDCGWVGEKQMWLEPQPWALIGGCVPPNKAAALVTSINELARKPSPIGALLQSQPDPTMKDEPGTGTNGGIFAAINGTLIWALALVNGEMAWDEWLKNTLARHSETYPEMWFGIWSGPDAYHSVFSKYPGGTGPDFPVLNMHAHAWPLYSSVKLLGAQFLRQGIRFKPVIPLDAYEFNSALLGFKKDANGYSGWYAPGTPGRWDIEVELPDQVIARLKHITVNGAPANQSADAGRIRFSGESTPSRKLEWSMAWA